MQVTTNKQYMTSFKFKKKNIFTFPPKSTRNSQWIPKDFVKIHRYSQNVSVQVKNKISWKPTE